MSKQPESASDAIATPVDAAIYYLQNLARTSRPDDARWQAIDTVVAELQRYRRAKTVTLCSLGGREFTLLVPPGAEVPEDGTWIVDGDLD